MYHILNPTPCFFGDGNTSLWAVSGTVLPCQHGQRRTFQVFGLLGNVNSTMTKSSLCDMYDDGRMGGGVMDTVQLSCLESQQIYLEQVVIFV